MDFKLFTNRFIFENQDKKEIGNVTLGGKSITCDSGLTVEIFRETNSATSANGCFLYVQIVDEKARPFYVEVYAFIVDGDTHIATYSFNADSSIGFSGDALVSLQQRLETMLLLLTTRIMEMVDIVLSLSPLSTIQLLKRGQSISFQKEERW